MKKISILLMFMFLLSGCSVNYEMCYIDGLYNESASINIEEKENCGDDLCRKYVDDFYNSNFSINYNDNDEELVYGDDLSKFTFYNKEYNNDKLSVNYSFDNSSEYMNSSIVNKLFSNFSINDSYIMASNINNIFDTYPYLDKIIISFKTDKYLLNSNCDEEKEGILYWYINKDNYLNKNINIEFDVENNNQDVFIDDGYLTWNGIKYIMWVIVVIVLIVIVYIYEKIKKSND